MKKLFTERQSGGKPRVAETLDHPTRLGIVTLLSTKIDQEWLGLSFPDACGDGFPHAGTDRRRLQDMMTGYGLPWPPSIKDDEPPADGQVFDLIEFVYEFIAEPTSASFHSFMNHMHYSYDRAAGRETFSTEVNRLFERNGSAFEIREGEIIRLAPGVLQKALAEDFSATGDAHLDALLVAARQKFLNRSADVRRESLEKLWDAWERLKTLAPGDKKAGTKALLDAAAKDLAFRSLIEKEARELTDIGNSFMIRHAETTQTPLVASDHVDYLFARMFALVHLLLVARTSPR